MGLINSTVEDVGKRITRSDLSNTKDIYLSLSKKFQDIYITETYNLSATRLIPGGHFVEWREARKSCVYCRYLSKQGKIEIDHKNPPQTQHWCIKCNIPLCCSKARPNCFQYYHANAQ